MKRLLAAHSVLLLTALLAVSIPQSVAQSTSTQPAPEELSRTLAALDGALFDSFNRCDLEKFATFFVEDVEFYHDKGGAPTGVAKFIHLWQYKDGAWKITRGISYDHAPAPK